MTLKTIIILILVSLGWGFGLTVKDQKSAIVAVEVKIAECDTKPEKVLAEKVAVYESHIRWVVEGNPSFAIWIGQIRGEKLENGTGTVAEVKAELIREKLALEKVVTEPNEVKPKVEEIPK